MNNLRTYQGEGIKRCHKRSMALFWEMGLGKTRTILEIIPHEPCLNVVVAPISATHSWENEVKKWRDDIVVTSSVGLSKQDRAIVRKAAIHKAKTEPTILLMNYEQAAETASHFIANNIDIYILVADESSYIKNHRAQRTQGMLRLRTKASRAYALSGTPILHGLLDLYSQIKFVEPDVMTENFWSFRNRYAVMGGFEKKQIVAYKNSEHLMSRIKPWAMSLRKDEVATDLPPKIYEPKIIQLSAKEMVHYNKIKEDCIMELKELDDVPITNILTRMMKLHQAASGFNYYEDGGLNRKVYEVGSTKRKAVADLLVDGGLAGNQVIVWTVFRYEQERLVLDISNAGLIVASNILGKSAIDAAQQFINGEADILVSNPQSLGYGMNLQCARAEIFISNTYRYGDREQAEARIHRMGQKYPVTIVDIIAEKTIDERIQKILKKKATIAEAIMEELGIEVN